MLNKTRTRQHEAIDDTRTIYLPIAIIHAHLPLLNLNHGNHVVFSRRSTISSTHTLDGRYVALPSAYSQFHSLWETGIVFPCPYHDACVLRMSLLYSAFEVQPGR